MKQWLIRRLGGYVTLDDFLEETHDSQEKHRILTQAVEVLYNTVSSDDILKVVNGEWYFEGKPLQGERVKALQDGAKAFLDSTLYKTLDKELKYQANRKMFVESQTTDDLIAGKLLLFLWDVIKTKLNKILN